MNRPPNPPPNPSHPHPHRHPHSPPVDGPPDHALRLGALEALLLEVPIAPPERERFHLLARPASLISGRRVERQSRGPLFAYLAMSRNRSHNAP
ncbi:MAG: hypothetical protein HYY93_16775 [Planctomycetes bacterium]|nr:hypothetical protein [Planctomycetota bacterium]